MMGGSVSKSAYPSLTSDRCTHPHLVLPQGMYFSINVYICKPRYVTYQYFASAKMFDENGDGLKCVRDCCTVSCV